MKDLLILNGARFAVKEQTTCKNCIYANICIMYEPNMKRCLDYKRKDDE